MEVCAQRQSQRTIMPSRSYHLRPESIVDPKDPEDPTFWSSWADRLRVQLDAWLPSWTSQGGLRPLDRDAFVRALTAHEEALQTIQNAQELRDALAKQVPPADKEQLDRAVRLVDAAQRTVDATDEALQALASLLLQDPKLRHLTSCCCDDSDLLRYSLIANATPQALADWCKKGKTSTEQLLQLFNTPSMLQKVFQAADAGWGRYCGRAVQLWIELVQLVPRGGNSGPADPALSRLALAVALEFCGPELDSHPVERNPLDPVARFRHYRQAYEAGELDPAFATFTVWELRMAVNSDATEDELQWGRTCLRNYRPDIADPDYDPHWRYCFLVRTDVDYKEPEWYKPRRTYDQILSGGGECGPRAWYGRFVCKAFGIPTWGVRQPGHAAMARWTPTGWVTCLGAGFQVSDWDGRCGNDFELETKARAAVVDDGDAEYRRLVLRLELLARFRGESDGTVRSRGQPDSANLWFSLSLLQRKLLAAQSSPPPPPNDAVVPVDRQVSYLRFESDSVVPPSRAEFLCGDDGSIVVPASSATIDQSNAGKAAILNSWGGGHQLLLSRDGEARFSLPPIPTGAEPTTTATTDLLTTTATYRLTLLVCTVHRIAAPLLLTIDQQLGGGKNSPSPPVTVEVALPYTVGAWQETDLLELHLPAAATSTTTVLTVKRQEPKLGLSIKYLKLVPTSSDAIS